MTQALVRRAFEERLDIWAAAQTPPIPVAWQNVIFKPSVELARFVEAHLLPAPTRSRGPDGKHREYRGVFQVTLYLPLNTGPSEAETLLASLDAAYPMSTPLVVDEFKVWVTSPMSAGNPLNAPDRFVVPVSCYYRSDKFLE